MSEMGMTEFEEQLMEALRRVDAPEGFAARVMERAAEGAVAASARVRESGPGAPRVVVSGVMAMRARFAVLSGRAWVGGAIAAALVLGAFVGDQVHVRRERERAALATQQFETATRVTDHALDQVRAQLARAGVLQDE